MWCRVYIYWITISRRGGRENDMSKRKLNRTVDNKEIKTSMARQWCKETNRW